MALGRLVYLASLWIFLLSIKDCGGYYYNYYSSRDTGIGTAVGIVTWMLSMLCCCIFCCRGNRNVEENVNNGEMEANQGNQQRIVTYTASAGVHYSHQPEPYSSSSTEVLSPSQLYSYSGQYNTPFQYGIESRDHSFGVASPPPYEEAAPSYESVVGRGTGPSYTAKGNT